MDHFFFFTHPTKYGEILAKKMREHGSHAWLVNTGWSGGGYGVGNRMSLKITRKIIDSILDGSLEKADFESFKIFGFEVPKSIEGVDSNILNPENTWSNKDDYNTALEEVSGDVPRELR